MTYSPDIIGGDGIKHVCPERVVELPTGDGREPLDPAVLLQVECPPDCPGPCEVPSIAVMGLTRWRTRVSVGQEAMCPDELRAIFRD
jgi:hypothetical protein